MKTELRKELFNKELWKKIFNIFIYILSAYLILYFCFSPNGLIEFVKNSEGLKLNWLFAAMLCHIGNLAIDSLLMYKFICNTSHKIKYKHAFNVAMTGQFFNSVTPSASGGQPMQILLMHHYGFSPGEGLSALIQKFIVWQFTSTGYSVIVLIFRFDFFMNRLDSWLKLVAIFGFISQLMLLIFLLVVAFSKKFTFKIVGGICHFLGKIKILKHPDETIQKAENQLESFHTGNQKLSSNKKFLVEIYLISIIHVTVIYMAPYCIYRSFGLDSASLFDIICSQTFVNITSMLVPTPGSTGAAELCFAGFFGNVFTKETLQSAILLWRTITYYSTIFISAPFAGFAKNKTKK